MDERKEACNCQDVCEVVSYEITHSTSEWPSIGAWAKLAQDLGILGANFTMPVNSMDRLLERRRIRGQMARVHIFFESNERTMIEQIAIFGSFWNFFNTLGGAISIYLGVSVMAFVGLFLTLFELISFVLF